MNSISFALAAKAKIRLAKWNYQYINVDNSYLKECCYNIHQSIFFSLIYMIDFYGITYSTNPDIKENLTILGKINDYIPYLNDLLRLSPKLLSWYVGYGNNFGFTASSSDIWLCFKIANDLVSRCGMLEAKKQYM